MGLAASQCRLLMLTARKDDVEGSLLKLSNQKLTLARDTADVAEEYSNALNATKLVYKDGDTSFDLTYSTLMRPSSKVDGQYLLTNASGNVLLDDKYAALFGGGNSQSGSEAAGSCSVNTFVSKSMPCTTDEADAYIKGSSVKTETTNGTNVTSGMDAPVNNILDIMVNSGFIQNNEGGSVSYDTSGNNSVGNGNVYTGTELTAIKANLNKIQASITTSLASDDMKAVAKGTATDAATIQEYQKILQMQRTVNSAQQIIGAIENINKEVASGDSKYSWKTGTDAQLQVYTGALNLLLTGGTIDQMGPTKSWQIEELLNGGAFYAGSGKGEGNLHNGTSATDDAWDSTYYNPILKLDYSYDGDSNASYDAGADWSKDTLGAPAWGTDDCVDSADNASGLVFTQNLLSLYYSASDAEDAAGTQSVTTTTKKNTSNADADFYINLYNAIVKNGWKKSSSIDDNSYLQNAIKNGGAYLYQMQSDGSWCLASTSGTDSCVSEVSDDAAAKKAEAKYKSETAKIEYKEKQIDLKINNLDTERSALTTQTESVKKIIEKNIEAFKIFQNA